MWAPNSGAVERGFAGVSLNQLWTGDHPRLIEPGSRWERKWKEGLFVWPGFFFGLRYGR